MHAYLEIIKEAFIFFPFIAILISFPFILIEYHKYGSISLGKVILTYSFVLYLINAYFLVILPLPEIEKVAKLTAPRTQLYPFKFIYDFVMELPTIKVSGLKDIVKILTLPHFYIPLYNIILTMPFGMYLKYKFNLNIKKVALFTFLLSLFFELTQLTGLYFIYPRGYRLFDVDDLLLNTLGGIVGYFIINPFLKILPTSKQIEEKAKKKGKTISGLRRTTSLITDFIVVITINFILSFYIKFKYTYIIISIIYYFIIPIFTKGSTIIEKFLNIKVVNENDKNNYLNLLLRKTIFVIIYIAIPYFMSYTISYFNIDNFWIKLIFLFSYLIILLMIYIISTIKYIFTNNKMLYEKLSKTKQISTIKI